jgi:hypothetical protein
MKNKLKQIAIFVLCLAIGFESIHLAFWLMNMPSTPLFWLGILVLTAIAFISGTYVWQKVGAWIEKKFEETENSNHH